MRAGNRATLVEIQRSEMSRSRETNAEELVWSKLRDAWVSFVPTRGSEDFVDGTRESQRIVRMIGDYLDFDGVTPEDRIVDITHGGDVLDIKAVLPRHDTRGECMIECTQGIGSR